MQYAECSSLPALAIRLSWSGYGAGYILTSKTILDACAFGAETWEQNPEQGQEEDQEQGPGLNAWPELSY